MTSNEYLYIGHLIIEGHGTQFEIDVFPQPLRENGRPFDLIIGRSILKQGVLLLDYINNRHTFSLPKG